MLGLEKVGVRNHCFLGKRPNTVVRETDERTKDD